jgi:pSer/pThr/pTyr-binding forkhead associated (FHA) protein
MNPSEGHDKADAPKRQVTVLESVEEIRALARRGATVREALPSTVAIPSPAEATEPFRPADRLSMALLIVLDDGEDSGEVIRIRGSTFVIGRVEGDLVIPHDGGISSRHAEISRRIEGGHARWFLRDLQSTNGTFVRASQVILHDEQEVLIGRGRFRFESAEKAVSALEAPPALGAPANATRKWQAPSVADLARVMHPSLVELTADGDGRRFTLTTPEVWIGREAGQGGIMLSDATVDPRHARARRDAKNRWVLENARSLNGLWARIQEIPLDRGGQFQCGEQRFLIKVL